jgi:hypothetical protein
MGLQRQLARMAAAVVLIAAFAVPSLARAHEGHAHHPPRATQAVPAAPDTRATDTRATDMRAADMRAHEQRAAASAAALSTPRGSNTTAGGVTPCGGNCCSGGAGMACCGAALAPESFWIPLLQASAQLGIPRAPPLPGLPPEALPKPPKSIA